MTHQLVQLGRVRHLYVHKPSFFVRTLIDDIRVSFQLGIDSLDDPRDRRVEIRNGLDRFYRPHRLRARRANRRPTGDAVGQRPFELPTSSGTSGGRQPAAVAGGIINTCRSRSRFVDRVE